MKSLGTKIIEAKKQNERGREIEYFCSLSEKYKCPLLKQNKCLQTTLFGKCVYGSRKCFYTKTKRAKIYNEQINKLKEKQTELPKLPDSAHKCGLQEIGDYIYLPYSHMDMCKEIPFLQHSVLFINGVPFIEKESFTPENIITLIEFKPIALMGGEIKKYQEKEIPLFLLHLKIKFPQLYDKIIKLKPSIEKKILDISNIKKLSARLSDIPNALPNQFKLKYKAGDSEGINVIDRINKYSLIISGKEEQFGGFLFMSFKIKKNSPVIMQIDVLPKTEVFITDKNLILETILQKPELIQNK